MIFYPWSYNIYIYMYIIPPYAIDFAFLIHPCIISKFYLTQIILNFPYLFFHYQIGLNKFWLHRCAFLIWGVHFWIKISFLANKKSYCEVSSLFKSYWKKEYSARYVSCQENYRKLCLKIQKSFLRTKSPKLWKL